MVIIRGGTTDLQPHVDLGIDPLLLLGKVFCPCGCPIPHAQLSLSSHR